jgi:hypothetical protein
MVQDRDKPDQATEEDIEAPRLTPQGREDPSGEGKDSTDPEGSGAKKGQPGKAEGQSQSEQGSNFLLSPFLDANWWPLRSKML